MAIRQLASGQWQADTYLNGGRVRANYDTREEAAAWLADKEALKARQKVRKGPLACPEGPATETVPKADVAASAGSLKTLGEAMDRAFDRYYKGTKYEKKTRQQMDRVLEYWTRSRPVQSIDSDALDAWIEAMKVQGRSGSTINRYLAVMSKVLRFVSARTGMARPIIERETEGQGRIRWLSWPEERTLLGLLRTWGKDEHADVVTILLDTGMRPGELYEMEAADLNLETGAIHIWKNKTDNPRTIYATPRVAAILAAKVQRTASGPLFPYDTGWMRNVWDRAKAHMGLSKDDQFIPYACRHTCASRMVQAAVPLNVVKEWLGHKTLQMTMRYAHLSPVNLMDAAATLAKLNTAKPGFVPPGLSEGTPSHA